MAERTVTTPDPVADPSPRWQPATRSRVGTAGAPRSPRLRLISSAVTLGVLCAAVLVVPLVVGLDQQVVDLAAANQPPGPAHWFGAHWFGTDELGRDVLLRCVYGLRVSLTVGLAAALIRPCWVPRSARSPAPLVVGPTGC